jgi:hypothetical protein
MIEASGITDGGALPVGLQKASLREFRQVMAQGGAGDAQTGLDFTGGRALNGSLNHQANDGKASDMAQGLEALHVLYQEGVRFFHEDYSIHLEISSNKK